MRDVRLRFANRKSDMIIIRITFAFLAIAILNSVVLCQQETSSCGATPKYENKNQIDYGPLELSNVSGRVITEAGNPPHSLGIMPGPCISVFTEDDHVLVVSITGNENGTFSLSNLQPGNYRLIVRDTQNAFCVANTKIAIIKLKQRAKGKKIVVHLRPAGIDDCSYMTYK